MPEVTVNGLRLNYTEHGSGSPVVLLHGLMGNVETWRDTTTHLETGFRVVAYDARGHGRSDKPDDPSAYSQELLVADLQGLLDRLGLDRCTLVGHSMGAGVSLNFALKHPERCLGLVLVGIGTGSSAPEQWQEWWGRLADLAEQQGMAAVLAEMQCVPSWRDAVANPRFGNELRAAVLENSAKAIVRVIRGIQMKRGSIFKLEPSLKASPVSTLVVFSESDEPVVECSRFLARTMPHATLRAIPARSHWTYLEAPDEFQSALDDLLSRTTT
jgi:pimeloyl-ACP methyl ester carboxylesterase